MKQIRFFPNRSIQLTLFALILAGLSACSHTTPANSEKSTGRQQKMQVKVGEIKEITLSSRGDSQVQLIGTSDNTEVVDVSRRQLTPAVDTLSRSNNGPTVFQLKGVTTGTAKVIFTEKNASETGSGRVRKTYLVQVVNQ